MNSSVGPPEIGQWYSRTDKGEMFQVVGRDESSRTIEIQSFGGDLDEIDEDAWGRLPLERAAPPEDSTGPLDDIEADDLGYSETAMQAADWNAPLQLLGIERETWTDTRSEDERDPLGEGAPEEPLMADLPDAEARSR